MTSIDLNLPFELEAVSTPSRSEIKADRTLFPRSQGRGKPSKHSEKKEVKATLTMASFFAGIGGFDLGFQQMGFLPVFHCEKDPFCLSILSKHWSSVPTASDISEVMCGSVPDCAVWTGGFPCQDVSVARGWLGRDGLNGSRTGLFFSFLKLIQERRPKVVLLENVTGLLNSHDGKDFQTVISSLSAEGYGVSWRILNSRYFGSPQSRSRVFICAWLGEPKSAVNALYEEAPAFFVGNERQGFLTASRAARTSAVVPQVAYCLAATSGRHTGTDWSRSYVSYHDQVRRLTPLECESLQGFPKNWTALPLCPKWSEDDLDSKRYHALGNAVCVPVIKWIASRIKAGLQNPPKDCTKFTAKNTAACLTALFPRLVGEIPVLGDLSSDAERSAWRSGGVAYDGKFLTVKVSCSPCQPIASQFGDIIEKEMPANRYFLSPNAATGILRRVTSQKRSLFQPLHEALSRLSRKQ